MLFFFPRDVLDEILDLIGSVPEGFPTYSGTVNNLSAGRLLCTVKSIKHVVLSHGLGIPIATKSLKSFKIDNSV